MKLNELKKNEGATFSKKRVGRGPGSGLGICFLVKDPANKYYTIGGSESGHMDFFSKNKKQSKQ